jgi:outer membrane biosynthesis protein TonB
MYDPNDRFKDESQNQAAGSYKSSLYSSESESRTGIQEDEPQLESVPVKPAAKPSVKPAKKKPVKSNINISNRQLGIIVGVFAVLVVCLILLIAVGFYLNAR